MVFDQRLPLLVAPQLGTRIAVRQAGLGALGNANVVFTLNLRTCAPRARGPQMRQPGPQLLAALRNRRVVGINEDGGVNKNALRCWDGVLHKFRHDAERIARWR